MSFHYCCYWCNSVYNKERVEKHGHIEYYNNYGFKILSGFCQGKNHQNRRSKCDLYRIKDDFVYESLNNKFYFKEERLLQFMNMCQKKMYGRRMWYQKKLKKKEYKKQIENIENEYKKKIEIIKSYKR